ncbi:MAG: hypothetical protein JOY66_00730 [Acetobacteraceae bacterium]|nr:hypothetical protein [Acetobacteraceae bacterium]
MSLTPPPTPPARGGACRTTPPPLAGGGRGEGADPTSTALRLLGVLDRENAALAALDLARAASMLAEKEEAVAAFIQASRESRASPDLARLAPRLGEAASRNRQLLERGIAVQGRVLAVIARAASRALAAQAPERCSPRYGATGGAAPARMALALSLRA